jgi:hypothetical protein
VDRHASQPQPLIAVFAAMPAVRRPRGKRSPFPPPASRWPVVRYGVAIAARAPSPHGGADGHSVQALDLTHATLFAATLHAVCRHGVPGRRGVVSPPPAPAGVKPPWTSTEDATVLQPARRSWGPLLAALAHRLGLTLAQQAVEEKTHASTQVETVLRQLVLPSRVLTMEPCCLNDLCPSPL